MTLYDQDTDIALLLRLFKKLQRRMVIDIGAERGSLVDQFLTHGAERIFAIEPLPRHAAYLRDKYVDPKVTVLELAAGQTDGPARLHIAESADGQQLEYFHSLVAFEDTSDVRWPNAFDVQCRTLASLVASGVVPPRVGVLKSDTEGNDLNVLLGLGPLVSDLLMVEFWHGFEDQLGPCPYRVDDLVRILQPRGYSSYALIKRHEQFETIQVNDAWTRRGDWGNAIFVHADVLSDVGGILFGEVAAAGTRLIDRAIEFSRASDERLRVIQRLTGEPVQVDGFAESGAYDVATLRGLNSDGDIAPERAREQLRSGRLPEDGVFIGRGWYPLERFGGETFRWVAQAGDIVVTSPSRSRGLLRLQVEPGPALADQQLSLEIADAGGHVVAAGRFARRDWFDIDIAFGDDTTVQQFTVRSLSHAVPTPGDGRVLNFRVFSVELVMSTGAAE
ncbi:MAG: hypothetical protein NVSMB2_01860 [Chloroflexota bacterium]